MGIWVHRVAGFLQKLFRARGIFFRNEDERIESNAPRRNRASKRYASAIQHFFYELVSVNGDV